MVVWGSLLWEHLCVAYTWVLDSREGILVVVTILV